MKLTNISCGVSYESYLNRDVFSEIEDKPAPLAKDFGVASEEAAASMAEAPAPEADAPAADGEGS